MTQLTGQQTGTAENDVFLGNFHLDVVADIVGEGIVDATIDTFSGDDRVEGSAFLVPATDDLTVSGIGISTSAVDTGSGDDTVIAIGFGSRFFDGFGIRGPEFSGTGSSYGLFSSAVDTGAGDDTLTFAVEIETTDAPVETGESFGLFDSVVEAGRGNDSISISGKVGAVQGRVSGGGNQDTIEIEARSVRDAIGIDDSVIAGDSGDDIISVSARGAKSSLDATFAMRASRIVGGSGNDTISITASDVAIVFRDFFGTSSRAIGADADSVIQGFSGDDIISLTASADAAGTVAYGAFGASIGGGNGNDTITLSAIGAGLGSTSFGALEANIGGGGGDDVITLIGESNSSSGTFAGASDSRIRGGSGNDTITLIGRSNVFDVQDAAGVIRSSVSGGSGNDRFEVKLETTTSATETVADYNIVDSLLGGDGGDDIFDVGIGNGTLTGGEGNDLAIVSYFDADTMSVDEIAGGVRITGTQTNNGEAGAWSQDLVGIESFVVGDIAYTAADFVSAFGS